MVRYRPDIDGLRALSITVVLAFHLHVAMFGHQIFPGGFVGVDVFFVVSGYLISGLIFSEIKAGTFSYSSFYKRRIVRIVPALTVITIFVILVGVMRLFPAELTKLAKSIIASDVGVSNVFFYLHTNYFEDSESNPLLHTWSLGVEEQFYLLMPSLLILLKDASSKARKVIVSALFVVSLASSIWWSHADPPAGFYLLPSRAWELLTGTLVTIGVIPPITRRLYREIIAVIGVLAISFAAIFYDPSVPFPGVAALAPCLGALAIIVSSESEPTYVSRLFSLRPIVFVGLISYSLYLWHWPLIAFQGFGGFLNTGVSPIFDRVLMLPVALAAAILSWRFIERPFRESSIRWPRSRRAWAAMGTVMLTLICSAILVAVGGLPDRFSPEAARFASYLSYDGKSQYRTGECFLLRSNTMKEFDKDKCLRRDPNKKTFLIIGDSHAAHLYYGIQSVYGEQLNVMQATATGCMPVISDGPPGTTCQEMNQFIFTRYLVDHRVDELIISARWDRDAIVPLLRTVSYLRGLGIKPVIVGPTMEFDIRLPRLLAVSGGSDVGIQRHVLSKYARLNEKMMDVVPRNGSTYIDAYDILCPGTECKLLVGQEPIYSDTGHLTAAGSVYLATKFRESGALPF